MFGACIDLHTIPVSTSSLTNSIEHFESLALTNIEASLLDPRPGPETAFRCQGCQAATSLNKGSGTPS